MNSVTMQTPVMMSAAPSTWDQAPAPDSSAMSHPWTRLAELHGDSPFCEPYWFITWRRHFGDARTSAVVTYSSAAGGWEFAAPLELAGGVARTWRYPYNPHTPYLDFAAERRDPTAVAELVNALQRQGDALELGMIPSDGWLCRGLLQTALSAGMSIIQRPQPGRAVLSLQPTWAAMRDELSRELTSGAERKERNLSKLGKLQYERVSTPARLAHVLPECFDVELAAWKGAIGTAMASKPATRGFYSDLAAAAAERDQLGLYTLRLDDRLIAFEYCLRRRGVVTLLKLSYLNEFSKQSPGNVLRLSLLRDEIERGAVEYDFGIESEWKTRWTKRVDGLCYLCLYFNGPRGRLGYWLGPGLRQAVKSAPGVSGALEVLRRRRAAAKQARQAQAKAENRAADR